MLSVFTNPRGKVVDTLTNRVEEVRYRHKKDGKWYKHKFKPGASLRLLANGDALLERPDGKPVWGEFAGTWDEGTQKYLTNPGEGEDIMHRARNRFGRFTKRHTGGAPKRRRRRRATAAAPAKRRRRRATRARTRVTTPRRRRRRHTAVARRTHRRRYRRNAPGAGLMRSITSGAVNGGLVKIGEIGTTKLGGLARQYVPGLGKLTGIADAAPEALAAVAGTFVVPKITRRFAPMIIAGLWAGVYTKLIASNAALSSALGAYPGTVALPAASAGNRRAIQGTGGLHAWPRPAVVVPKMRVVG